MAYRVTATSFDRKRNPKTRISFFGKTKSAAKSQAKKFFRRARNCQAEFEGGEQVQTRPTVIAVSPNRKRRRKANRRRNSFSTPRERAAFAAGMSEGTRRFGTGFARLKKRRAARHRANPKRKKNSKRVRRNRMPAALAKYWQTHPRKKNARRKR